MNIDSNVFIAPGAQIIGDVSIKSGSSIWYNAVLRGDKGAICIGSNTNIQDLVMVHVSKNTSTVIGDNVTVGHGAIIHGCTIEDNVLIGMGSIILDRAQIGKNSIVGAGSLVTQGKCFPEGSLILGSPARVKRPLTAEEIENVQSSAKNYAALAGLT